MRADVGKPFVRPDIKENTYNAVRGLFDFDALENGIIDIEKVLDRVLMVKDGRLVVNTDVSKIAEDGKTVEDLFREVFSNVG